MNIEAIEIWKVSLPLVRPFRTAFGTERTRLAVLVRVIGRSSEGWGESGALPAPTYSGEYSDDVVATIADHFAPALLALRSCHPHDVAAVLSRFKGHETAKAALEAAVLDAQLREWGISLATYLGGTRSEVRCGVSVGITESVDELLRQIDEYLAAGYLRVKLKIEPGWDVAVVAEVRKAFGDDLALQVDANAAYRRSDIRQLARLDEFDLELLEQPLPAGELLGHAELRRRLRTPLCLDESIVAASDAWQAIHLGACDIVNIKTGRVGGVLPARAIHDLCRAAGIAVWCGGMLETGVGRAANLALASLPGFTLPGDTSASERYFAEDITEPFVLHQGTLTVPTTPGIGVAPRPDRLHAHGALIHTVIAEKTGPLKSTSNH